VNHWDSVTDKKSTDAKGEDSLKWEADDGSSGKVEATGTIGWDFPKQITLRSNGAGKYTTTFDTTQVARLNVAVSGNVRKEPRKYGIFTATNTLDETTIQGDGKYSPTASASYRVTVEEVPSFDRTTSSTSSKPTSHNEPLISFDPEYTGFKFDQAAVLPRRISTNPVYVWKPGAKPSSESSNSQSNENKNKEDTGTGTGTGTEKPSQLMARLEHDQITVEAGFLPSTRSAIIISGWDRTISKPIQVSYPGLGFMNELPYGLKVFSGAGGADPSAMSRGENLKGEYTWIESYDAKRGAAPGVYQIPIIVSQEGAGSVQLVQTIKIVPSRNASGSLTMLQNRTQPPEAQATPTPPAPTYTPPTATHQAPRPTDAPLTPTHQAPRPTTSVIPQTPPKADWRNMPGFWAGGNGSVVAIQRNGNFVSGWFVQPGSNMDQFAGDWCFVNAGPTSPFSDTVTTETGFCYQEKGGNREARVYPRAHMSIKISPDGNSLTYTYNCRGMGDDNDEKSAVDTRTTWSGTVPRPGSVPTTAPPSATPSGAASHNPPASNKPTGFAGTWQTEAGRVTFTDLGGGKCRGEFTSESSTQGSWDGVVVNGVFNGTYNETYRGAQSEGRITIKLNPEKPYLFKADWTSSTTGNTGSIDGVKPD
jgi:hypothetical protein